VKKLKIFISGEWGQIARELIKQLLKREDVEIINFNDAFDLYRTYNHYDKNSSFLFRDFNRQNEINIIEPGLFEVFNRLGCDMIIHCAAYVNTDKVEHDLMGAIDSNIKGTYNLVNIAKQLNIKFVNFSTTATFDVESYSSTRKMTEFTPRKPTTYYGQTKLCSENIVKWNLSNYINFLPVFFYGIYPSDNSSEIVKITYNTINNRAPITVKLSLDNMKAYFYIEDAVDAIVKIIFNDEAWNEINRDFIIATNETMYYRDYLELIMKELKTTMINANFVPEKDYLHNHIADNSKMLKFAVGWEQKTFMKDGIKKIIDSIKGVQNV
jgi:nucleoside-diphosphate-sugar epimerase